VTSGSPGRAPARAGRAWPAALSSMAFVVWLPVNHALSCRGACWLVGAGACASVITCEFDATSGARSPAICARALLLGSISVHAVGGPNWRAEAIDVLDQRKGELAPHCRRDVPLDAVGKAVECSSPAARRSRSRPTITSRGVNA